MRRSISALLFSAIVVLPFALPSQAADQPPPAAVVVETPATAPASTAPAAVVTTPAVPATTAPAAATAPAADQSAEAPAVPAADIADAPPDQAFVAKPYPAVFFWPDEVQDIYNAIDEHDHPAVNVVAKGQSKAEADEEAARPHLPNVYVSAILDFGDGNWTVWANGMRVTPKQQTPLFRIVAVRGNAVDIVVPGADGGRFVLQPFQTWRSRQKDVVEGIVP